MTVGQRGPSSILLCPMTSPELLRSTSRIILASPDLPFVWFYSSVACIDNHHAHSEMLKVSVQYRSITVVRTFRVREASPNIGIDLHPLRRSDLVHSLYVLNEMLAMIWTAIIFLQTELVPSRDTPSFTRVQMSKGPFVVEAVRHCIQKLEEGTQPPSRETDTWAEVNHITVT